MAADGTIAAAPARSCEATRGTAASLKSGIYFGWVRHRRFAPIGNAFRYRVYMVALDLEELDVVFEGRWFWSTRRPALARFRRADYLGDPAVPLDEAVRDVVEEHLGKRPAGRVVLVTNLRCLGYLQNPVSFYYCHDADGHVESIVAEITNTPWSQRHRYVLPTTPEGVRKGHHRFEFEKTFHVSPFMPMDQSYVWHFSDPGERLTIHMDNMADGEKVFDATLMAERSPMTGPTLARALLRHPWMTAKVVLGIYFQALILKWKRVSYHRNPHLRSADAPHTGVGDPPKT